MTPRLLAAATAAAAATALAGLAGTAQAAPSAPAADSSSAATAAGRVSVSFAVNRFVRKGKQLVATGAAVATFTPGDGSAPTVVRQPYTAKVAVPPRLLRRTSAVARTCSVLYLQLDKLHLELLGLVVDLDKVTLSVTANSRGGALGSLFCQLANARVNVRTLAQTTRQLNAALRDTGLSTSAVSFAVPLAPVAAAQTATCEVLDLVLGPLDVRLLGLRVQLSQVHLTITANREGGVLGSLFCQLASAQVGLPLTAGG